MERFRRYLRHEFSRRVEANPRYSLRAFARALGINHATLSSLMTGRRTLTAATVRRLGAAIGLSPLELGRYLDHNEDQNPFVDLQDDIFAAMSEHTYDAVMELSTIVDLDEDAEVIVQILKISRPRARHILETLRRLNLLRLDGDGRLIAHHRNTSNILDESHSTAAQRRYQAGVLAGAKKALEEIPRARRSHTSLTVAMDPGDLPAAKELIRKFRRDLNAFAERTGPATKEIYQLQVSYFPLSERTTDDIK